MYQTFYGSANLTSLNLSNWDTSNVTNMYSMFSSICENSNSCNLNLGSNFYTNSATNMGSMFFWLGRNV